MPRRRVVLPSLLLSSVIVSTAMVAAQVPSGPPQPFPIPQKEEPLVPVIRLLDENPNQTPTRPAQVEPPLDPNGELQRQISRLHKEREDLARERAKLEGQGPQGDTPTTAELAVLRQRLNGVLKNLAVIPVPRLTTPGAPNPMPDVPPGVQHVNPPVPGVQSNPIHGRPSGDLYLQAQSLFRAGQYKEALAAYRGLQPESLNTEERLLVQYLCACCLRKLGRLDDAATLYREVADAREDDLLTECSLWHLDTIGWRRGIEKTLTEIRAARQPH